jgi:beta-galactosidase
VDDYGALDEALPLRANLDGLDGVNEATVWADEMKVTSAEVLATYAQSWLEGVPAITINVVGKGKVVYVGTVLRGETLTAFLSWLCALANVPVGMHSPDGVRAYERQSENVRLLFLMNFGGIDQTVTLDGEWQDTLTGEGCSKVELQPADVRILTRQK